MRWSHGPVGFVLATEEHKPRGLLKFGRMAEDAGFGFCFISDHFHPWNFQQGHSSNIWPLLGALATQTSRLCLLSAVTCPILRIHPTTLAQAASTVFHLAQGRFILGVGTGENLNEHVTGQGFPPFDERLRRLEEAVSQVRALLSGNEVSLRGEFFQVEKARLFDAAPELEIYFASSGPKSAELAGRRGDGLICLGPEAHLAGLFRNDPSDTRPRLAQLSVCWARDRETAERTAHKYFPEVAMEGSLFTTLQTPSDCARAAERVSPDDVAAAVVCGPDPAPYVRALEQCFEAGFDAVALHQIGPDQAGFFKFWETELRPGVLRA